MGRSLRVLLAGMLLFHAGWYLLLPYFAVLFTARRGLSPAEAGLVLASQSLALLLGSLAGGIFADRLGRRRTMLGGLWLRAAAIGALGIPAPSFGYAGPMTWYLLAAIAAGFGGGLYGPAAKAAIAMLTTETNRTTIFSYRGIAASVGVALGPALGALLIPGSMGLLFGASALLHAGMAILTAALPDQAGVERQVHGERFRDLITDFPFFLLSHLTGLAWMLFSQLAIALPLYASRVMGLEASIGLLFTVSSVVVIALQVPVTRYIIGYLQPMRAMAVGTVLLGAGLGLVGLARSYAGLVGAVLVFTMGQMLLLPSSDSAVALMARKGAVGAYFGLASLSWGLGEGIGVLAGGWLMGYALNNGLAGSLPWIAYAATGVIIGGLLWAASRWRALQEELRPATAGEMATIQVFRAGHPTPTEGVRLGGSGPSERGQEDDSYPTS